jgi:cohesin complex subunit SA-1/2
MIDYPLTSKKSAFRKFRAHLSSFIKSLISIIVSKDLITSDPALLENMRVWITALSSSTLRQFRHTATVFSLNIVSFLSECAAVLRDVSGATNRQLEAEKNKTTQNQARVQSLTTKVREGDERREAIEVIIIDIVDTVFVHRYRDVDFKIRIECIHGMCHWMHVLPDLFFENTYIRYIAWVLSDPQSSVRLVATQSLAKLYKKKDGVSVMRHLTELFKGRFLEIATRDFDTSVRVAAIELLDAVRALGYLEPDSIQAVGRLLFDSEQKVRRGVVGFFVENLNDIYQEKLEEMGGEELISGVLAGTDENNYEGPRLSWIKIKCLVETLAEYDQDEDDGQSQSLLAKKNLGIAMKVNEIVSRFCVAGAVLWEALEELRDWEGLARHLLYDHSAGRSSSKDMHQQDEETSNEDVEEQVKKAVALDTKEEIILLHILNASVTGSIHKGPEPTNKKKFHLVSREVFICFVRFESLHF